MQTSKGVCTLINAAKIARSLVAVSDEETEASAAVKYLARYFEVLPLGERKGFQISNEWFLTSPGNVRQGTRRD